MPPPESANLLLKYQMLTQQILIQGISQSEPQKFERGILNFEVVAVYCEVNRVGC